MTVLAPGVRPQLPHGTRLHRCAVRGQDFLLVPERALALTPTASQALALVDGARTVGDIAVVLAGRFEAPVQDIALDVGALLNGLVRERVVDVIEAGDAPNARENEAPKQEGRGSKTARAPNPPSTPSVAAASAIGPSSLPPGVPVPVAMLAELTHRCPLQCLYCSNPLALTRASGELSTRQWQAVFDQAAAMGVLQVHLSGGEPAARRDLTVLVAAAARTGLYTNLITSGIGLTRDTLEACAAAGLDHVQLSLQGADEKTTTRVAAYPGALEKKRAFARQVVETGLPLTVNAVIHRLNIAQTADLIDLALSWGARRIEIAHAQYHGWALANRGELLPSGEDVAAATTLVNAARETLAGQIVIDHVKPDHFARYPKACMGGWGRAGFNVTPSGRVLPCHAAETLPGLTFETVTERDLADIWAHGDAFVRYRGTGWMQEPCRTCPRREVDFGGCRCQAFAVTGDAAATDPACEKSPVPLISDQASGPAIGHRRWQ